jgi:hypothetical protein
MWEKALCLIFALILSINCFAAAVSDNDGSAFITKAEFDSLKNNFQSQIDQYNTSIDAKIDEAIASYLSGITIKKDHNIQSLLYKCAQIDQVVFDGSWECPNTGIRNRFKYGAYIAWEGAAVVNDDPLVAGNVNCGMLQVKWFDNYVLGLQLNEEGGDLERSLVGRLYTTTDGSKYLSKNSFYYVTPWATLTGSSSSMAKVGEVYARSGGKPLVVTNPAIDCANRTFGGAYDYIARIAYWTEAYDNRWERDINLAYVYGSEDEKIDSLSETYFTKNLCNIFYFAPGKVENDDQIYTVLDENWNTTHNSIMATRQLYKGQNGRSGIMSNGGRFQTYDYGQYDFSETGDLLIDYPVYMKKYSLTKVKDLQMYDYSMITNKNVKNYTGIPIVTADDTGVLKISMTFLNSNTSSDAGSFYLKADAFDNDDDISKNTIKLYSDKQCKTEITDYTIPSNPSVTKEFYINAEKNKTYWLKVKPSSENRITVQTIENYEMIFNR